MNDKYYVVKTDDFLDYEITVAKLDPETKQFYDYKKKTRIKDNSPYEIGKEVNINESGEFIPIENGINEEVVSIVNKNNEFYKQLEEKYKDQPEFSSENVPLTIYKIIKEFAKDRIANDQPVNLYVVDVIRLISEGMGLRVRWHHGGRLYHQISSFEYPEELYEIVSAMYDIVDEAISNDKSLTLEFYEYEAKGEGYIQFINEIERRTRYSANLFSSELQDRIRDESYHGENWGFSERRRQLSIMKPVIYINSESTVFLRDRAGENKMEVETTPELAKERLEAFIGKKTSK